MYFTHVSSLTWAQWICPSPVKALLSRSSLKPCRVGGIHWWEQSLSLLEPSCFSHWLHGDLNLQIPEVRGSWHCKEVFYCLCMATQSQVWDPARNHCRTAKQDMNPSKKWPLSFEFTSLNQLCQSSEEWWRWWRVTLGSCLKGWSNWVNLVTNSVRWAPQPLDDWIAHNAQGSTEVDFSAALGFLFLSADFHCPGPNYRAQIMLLECPGQAMALLATPECHHSRNGWGRSWSTRECRLAAAAEAGEYMPEPGTCKHITALKHKLKPQNTKKTESLAQLWAHSLCAQI